MHLSNIHADVAEDIHLAIVDQLRKIGIKHRVKKHVLPIVKHSQQIPKHGAVFRRPLQEIETVDTMLISGERLKVPHFVVDACNSIRQNLETEGIFRKAGSAARQKQMKAHIDKGKMLGMDNHEIDVANLLKLFLRELPEPLLPTPIQDIFLRCLLLGEKKVEGLLLACLLLPECSLNTLTYLMEFFAAVTSKSDVNRMDKSNIAIILTPTIMPLEQEKMTAMSSIRLNHHMEVIELLIQHADKIGVLPDSLCTIANASNAVSFSSSKREVLHKSEPDLLQSSKKKKSRRSGSLTRMFSGFKKMVANKAGPDSDLPVDESDASECAPLEPHTPACVKPGTKRKALIATSAFSMKKKRDILKALPDMQTLVGTPAASSWPTENPDLHTLTPCVCRHPNPRTATSPPPTGAKSKRFFATKHDKSDREQEVEKRSRLSLRGRKGAKKQEKKDDLQCSKMSTASNQSEVLHLESRWSSSIFGRKKRVVDVQMLEPAMEMVHLKGSSDSNPGTSCHAFSQSESNVSLDGINLSQQNNMSNDSDDFVRIPKKEYEAIKDRVSAIEDKMSEVFNNMSMSSNNTSSNVGAMQAEEVQTAYEKTLEESTTFDNTSSSTDNLAKRLGRDLKIRQSLENKVIRSPSARRIGTLRRRSKERTRSFRNNSPALRNATLMRNMSDRILGTPEAQSYPRSALKRGGPNTVWSGLPQPEPLMPVSPNPTTRIQLCFHNEHLNGTVPRAEDLNKDQSSLVVDSPSFSSPRTRSMLQRSLSCQESAPSSGSKIPVPVNYFQTVQASPRSLADPKKQGTKEWHDAQGFFKTNPSPALIPVTGRASVSKILEQNAGMVSQRMKIFNNDRSGFETVQSQPHRRSFDRPKKMEGPGPQFKRVMSALQMCQSTVQPSRLPNAQVNLQKSQLSFPEKASLTLAPIKSAGGKKSESPKKIGSPRKLSKAKCAVQRKKSNAANLVSPKVGTVHKSELKKNQKSSGLNCNVATSSKCFKNPMSPLAASSLQNSKENVSATFSQASNQMSPFIKPRTAVVFSPQLSLPDNLKETIYSVCTPDVDKASKRDTSMSPLKESNRACAKNKTPRETPYIKQHMLTITPHHFGKTPQKITTDRSTLRMVTPMRAIIADSCGTPLGLPRRQSPRLLLKAQTHVNTP